MVQCWAPGCKHYNVREECKFYRFPQDIKTRNRWIKLTRRTTEPGRVAFLCSCHFMDGKKENGPTIFLHNEGKRFNFPPPEKRTRRSKTEVAGKSVDIGVQELTSQRLTSETRFPSAIAKNKKVCPLRFERRDKGIATSHHENYNIKKTKYGRTCSPHFHTEKRAAGEDPDWVPSMNMGYIKKSKKINSQKNNKRNIQDKVSLKKSDLAKKASIPPNHQVEAEAEQNRIITVVDDLCRICFENALNMTPLSSVVCLNGAESLNLKESFQYLTGESDEQVDDPKCPNKICDNCINLLISAYEFKKKYDKTSKTLANIINIKTDEDNSSDSDGTLSAIQDEDGNFLEVDIIKDEAELLDILDGNDDRFHNKMNNINNTLDLFPINEKPEATNEKLYRCPICLMKCTKYELKHHARNHTELSWYIDRAPVYNKKIRFYVKPSRIQEVSNRKSRLRRHTCHLCKKTFHAAGFFKHMKLHGFHEMD